MLVSLSSRGREILDHGTVFLFDEKADLELDIAVDENFHFGISICFGEDVSGEQSIKRKTTGNRMEIVCMNFRPSGAGLGLPAEVAVVNGKKVYLMFWAYLEGADGRPKARRVDYTLYREK